MLFAYFSAMTDSERAGIPAYNLLTIRIPASLDCLIAEAGKRNQLTKSAIARLAIERGLAVLDAQLSSNPETANTATNEP
jgi:hypothetical protein